MQQGEQIRLGCTALGIELGSTRIKAVLIGKEHQVLAQGSFSWENCLENGLWSYRLDDAIRGLQESFADLRREVRTHYGVELETVGALGVSGMMHGYLPLDAQGRQLAPFLTWRNTNTTQAAQILTERFGFNIPLRWSIAQLYQAVLERQAHLERLDYITTLSGYIHYLLTGHRVIGVGDASGMFPIDSARMDYDAAMVRQFDEMLQGKNYAWKLKDVLPKVLPAGAPAGYLTSEGARLLDPSGTLHAGIPMAPPEGDAGTGMVATNSVAAGTGNVSAGTSIFSMVVLERGLSRIYRDVDMVATPSGRPVAMIHCNNGTSELDVWMQLFSKVLELCGGACSDTELYQRLFRESRNAAADCGGVLLYNFISGEPIAGLNDGRPLLVRGGGSQLTVGSFMRSQIYAVFAALSMGMEILRKEQVHISRLTGHGGLFKTEEIAQRYLAAAMNAPVTVMQTAGEGGPYGMALLAAYLLENDGASLEDYLEQEIFAGVYGRSVEPDPDEVAGYRAYLERYCEALPVEAKAVEHIS